MSKLQGLTFWIVALLLLLAFILYCPVFVSPPYPTLDEADVMLPFNLEEATLPSLNTINYYCPLNP